MIKRLIAFSIPCGDADSLVISVIKACPSEVRAEPSGQQILSN